MGQQLENTWNEMRRGLGRSWSALRQSAESAIVPQFGPKVALPTIQSEDALKGPNNKEPSLADPTQKNFTLALNRMKAAMSQPTAAFGPDSGKLDQWIERANRMFADALTDENLSIAPENGDKKNSKPPDVEKIAKKSGQEPTYSETIAYFTTKPRKSKDIIHEKKKPSL